MILTGHVLHEDTLTAQVAMNGSMMRSYAVMQYPGIDFLGQHGRVYFHSEAAAIGFAAARQDDAAVRAGRLHRMADVA